VRAYFEKLSSLLDEPDSPVDEGLAVYGGFSDRPLRLWYVAGCHMAQAIESEHGRDVLRELVRKGSGAFFKAYRETGNP
jgi:hypothetical protein